jgi:hypothetical protein
MWPGDRHPLEVGCDGRRLAVCCREAAGFRIAAAAGVLAVAAPDT